MLFCKVISQKELDSKILRPEAIAAKELEKLLKNLTPTKLKALQAILNMG